MVCESVDECVDIIQVLMGLSRGHIPLLHHSHNEDEDGNGKAKVDDEG